MLGLPEHIRACLFDLDGVLTNTAAVHAAAWREVFDAFLRARTHEPGRPFIPFDTVRDYGEYVDGKRREDGVRSFLAARGIVLPEGTPDDPPHADTVRGLAARKNTLVLKLLAERGIEVFQGSVRYVRAVRAAGLRTAVVSSSANTAQVLAAAGIDRLFEARIDGVVAEERGLAGKPSPDMFLAGAEKVGVAPGHAAVYEDALAGVSAGRSGGFAFVVGVDRINDGVHRMALIERGADVVVDDLADLMEDR